MTHLRYPFIVCLMFSISSERAANSPSESAIIVTATVECLRFCILCHSAQEEEDQCKIRTMLISQQVKIKRLNLLFFTMLKKKVLNCPPLPFPLLGLAAT